MKQLDDTSGKEPNILVAYNLNSGNTRVIVKSEESLLCKNVILNNGVEMPYFGLSHYQFTMGSSANSVFMTRWIGRLSFD